MDEELISIVYKKKYEQMQNMFFFVFAKMQSDVSAFFFWKAGKVFSKVYKLL